MLIQLLISCKDISLSENISTYDDNSDNSDNNRHHNNHNNHENSYGLVYNRYLFKAPRTTINAN